MDIAALSSQTGEALRAQALSVGSVARLLPPVVVGSAGRVGLSQAAVDYASLLSRADALVGLARGMRGVPGAETVSHKLYPPYPPEQQAQMSMLAATVAGLRSVDAAVIGADSVGPTSTVQPELQLADLELDTRRLLASTPSLNNGISQNRDRLLAIAQGSFAT